MTATATMLDLAIGYTRHNWEVFPAHTPNPDDTCSCHNPLCDSIGKHPRTTRGLHDATSDPAKVQSWWETWANANIAIRTGATSNLVVLDSDPDKGGTETLAALEAKYGTLPDTPQSITGRLGRHILFQHPGGQLSNSVEQLGPGLDVRADGGYIIAPGSLHRSGRRYAWDISCHPDDIPVAPLPDWLETLLKKPTPTPRRSATNTDGHIPDGRRNDTLFKAGCALRRHGATEEAIRAALLIDNQARCNPPLPEEDVRRIAASCMRYEPTVDGGFDHGFGANTASQDDGQPSQSDGEATTSDLPLLDAGDHDLPRISGHSWDALIAANTPPRLFRYGGILVRLEPDQRGVPLLTSLTEHRLRFELARAARWFKETKTGGLVPALPPVDVVRDLLAAPAPPLPALEALVAAPTFAADGSLQVTPGYHPAGRTYFTPANGFSVPNVPTYPTVAAVAHAKTLICDELLGEFPFTGPAELAHAVGVMLLSFGRNLIDGPTPLHLFEKPSPGTGATLLADVLLYPATGRNLAALTEGRDEEEWRKRLTAVLRTSPPAILIDNLKERLDTAALAAILTTSEHEDRILGTSDIVRIPVRAVWLASGNNPTLSNEITRRTVRIRLDAHQEHPWLRQDFRRPRLREWVHEQRPHLCHAALTLIAAWLAEGKPRAEDAPRLGMYENWSSTIGGILDVAGIPGFLGNLTEAYAHADAESDDARILIEAWWKDFNNLSVKAADLFPLVIQQSIPLDLGNGGDRAQRTRFGQTLTKLRDRRYTLENGRTVIVLAAGKKQGAQLWELREEQTA